MDFVSRNWFGKWYYNISNHQLNYLFIRRQTWDIRLGEAIANNFLKHGILYPMVHGVEWLYPTRDPMSVTYDGLLKLNKMFSNLKVSQAGFNIQYLDEKKYCSCWSNFNTRFEVRSQKSAVTELRLRQVKTAELLNLAKSSRNRPVSVPESVGSI